MNEILQIILAFWIIASAISLFVFLLSDMDDYVPYIEILAYSIIFGALLTAVLCVILVLLIPYWI